MQMDSNNLWVTFVLKIFLSTINTMSKWDLYTHFQDKKLDSRNLPVKVVLTTMSYSLLKILLPLVREDWTIEAMTNLRYFLWERLSWELVFWMTWAHSTTIQLVSSTMTTTETKLISGLNNLSILRFSRALSWICVILVQIREWIWKNSMDFCISMSSTSSTSSSFWWQILQLVWKKEFQPSDQQFFVQKWNDSPYLIIYKYLDSTR